MLQLAYLRGKSALHGSCSESRIPMWICRQRVKCLSCWNFKLGVQRLVYLLYVKGFI